MRPADDDYPTPPEATRALLSVERFNGGIWEPCAGSGAMAKVLRENYQGVWASTLATGGSGNGFVGVRGSKDFLYETKAHGANIITNPPFKIAEVIIRHAMEFQSLKIAMLLNLKFLASRERKGGLFKNHPPARVHVFCDRLGGSEGFYPEGYTGKRNSTTETMAWFIWDWPFKVVEPRIGWLDSKEFIIRETVEIPAKLLVTGSGKEL